MSNPPAGWYPDPTGQPDTIRWWNGTQWTNKTEHDGPPLEQPEPADAAPVGEAEAAESAPVQNLPIRSAPVQNEPVQSTPVQSPPVQSAPVQSAPVQSAPVQGPPDQGPPVQSAPDQGPPVQSAPDQGPPKLTIAPDPTGPEIVNAGEPPAEQTKPDLRVQPDAPTPEVNANPWTQTPAQPQPQPQHTQQPAVGADLWNAGGQQTGAAASNPSTQPAGTGPWNAGGGQQNVSGQWGPNAEQSAGAVRQGPGSGWGSTGQQSGGAAQWARSGTQQQRQQSGGGQGGSGVTSSGGGQGGGGTRTPLIIGGAAALVVLIVAAVFYFTQQGDDKKAEPATSPSPQASTSAQTSAPTSGPTAPTTSEPTAPASTPATTGAVQPGQSKDPKLHEGDSRVSSDAISFARQRPPWSERKRLVPQLLNSSGQYVLLQENYDGKNDWYADVFVGALGTATPFNGDPKTTAAQLLAQLHSSMYSNVTASFKAIGDGAVSRSDKAGWYYQETVTVNSPKLTSPILTLTVAVFDLGDGTAVAYISDIPANRPDLKQAESQAYKGINVG